MNNITIIIAQALGFISFIISLIAFHKRKKEKILRSMILSNIFDLIHYLLLEAYSGCITKLLAIFRNVFVIFKDKYKALSSNMFLYIFILLYIISGIWTFENIWSIFPIISALIYAIAIWKGNELTLKKDTWYKIGVLNKDSYELDLDVKIQVEGVEVCIEDK